MGRRPQHVHGDGRCRPSGAVRVLDRLRTATNGRSSFLSYLLDQVRCWPGTGSRVLSLPASHGKAAREASVEISWGPLQLLPPVQEPSTAPMTAWVVRIGSTAATPEVIQFQLISKSPTTERQIGRAPFGPME